MTPLGHSFHTRLDYLELTACHLHTVVKEANALGRSNDFRTCGTFCSKKMILSPISKRGKIMS